ncbi:protein O-linked-mannose beta-1,2-N-acetylglucosaminyltransferase 1-like [Dysidea avara]|uniref:protein O-linked-mannose beta-1,2-N-acetylglucosaminyltransferase 1-like n=1 Tax=Dysidea avara TaxID=196820 RepID=UPI00332783A4
MTPTNQWTLALVGIPTFLFIFICELFLFRRQVPKLLHFLFSLFLAVFSMLMFLSCSSSLRYIKNREYNVVSSSQLAQTNYFMLLTISLNGIMWFLLLIFYIARIVMPSSHITLKKYQSWLLRLIFIVLVVNAAGVNVFGVLAVDFSAVVVVSENVSLRSLQASLEVNTTMIPSVTAPYMETNVTVTTITVKVLSPLEQKRNDFCSQFPQYTALCTDENPAEFYVETKPFPGNNIPNVPVALVATNRTTRIHRSLYHLLQADGANKSLITVFLDGMFPMQVAVAKLFGVNAVCNPVKSTGMYRITEHYKYTLSTMFNLYPDAPYIIILEDDLEVSPDFFSFFSQTVYLMEEDDSIFCISAWNDFGYKHSSQDTSAVFRIDGMPGLGWLLSRSLYKKELEAKWPNESEPLTWDGWIREDPQLQGRECLIPEVSRTYHFDTGMHIDSYQQRKHFNTRSQAHERFIQLRNLDSLKREPYEQVIHSLLRQAIPIRRNISRCDYGLVPRDQGKIYVLFLDDDEKYHWTFTRCFNLWEYDVRAGHQDLWRLTIKQNQYLVMRCPVSPYCSYKPDDLIPMKFSTTRLRRPLRLG